jgi:hypothetical protein
VNLPVEVCSQMVKVGGTCFFSRLEHHHDQLKISFQKHKNLNKVRLRTGLDEPGSWHMRQANWTDYAMDWKMKQACTTKVACSIEDCQAGWEGRRWGINK